MFEFPKVLTELNLQKLQTEETARKHREDLLRKRAMLEEEINSLYPIQKKIKKDAESFA